MLPEIALEAFRFMDRTELETLQMHSRSLRDFVDRHARTLPLRYIHEVETACGVVNIHMSEEGEPIAVQARGEQDLEIPFHRVNNSFMDRLKISIREDFLTLPYYMRANANDLQCRVRVLHVLERDVEDTAFGIDYALVEFLGVHLKPQVYMTWVAGQLHEDYVMLFTHNALRGNVKHVDYGVDNEAHMPDCVVAEFFGVDVVETCTIMVEVDPLPWIGRFIEAFNMAGRGTDTIRSVTLLYLRFDEVSDLCLADVLPGQPPRAEVPAPYSAFIEKRSRETSLLFDVKITESTVAELFVFENTNAAKKLQVFAWTLEEVDGDTQTAPHYAFLLQVVDV